MTKYINKLTGVEQDYDQVCEAFECSLTWNGDCDPEEFLIEAYEDYFEDWLSDHSIEAIEVPDPVKPKKKAKRTSRKKQQTPIPIQNYGCYDAENQNSNYYGLFCINPARVAEDVITAYGSEDGFRFFVEHYSIPLTDNVRFHYASFLLTMVPAIQAI